MSEFSLMTAVQNERTLLLYSVVEFAKILSFFILLWLKNKKNWLKRSLPAIFFFQDKEEN